MREGKTLNAVLEDAFMAGVAHAQKRDMAVLSDHEAYLAWRDEWTGRPHESPTGATEPRPGDSPEYHSEWQAWVARQPKPTHRFDPGITGMSVVCNELVIRDGDTTECDLPREVHPS